MADDHIALTDLCARCAPVIASSADTPPARERILADIDALLARTDVLATALALTPAVPVIRDLAQHTSAIVYATRLIRNDLHGATLTKLVRRHVNQVIDALLALAQSILSGHPAKDCLIKTETLHDLISSARSGIPGDNRTAVYTTWKSDKDALDDNLRELANIIEEAESNPDDVDDGWDELGLAHATNLDTVELVRAKKVHQVLRLTTLLHKRIWLDLLPYSSAPLSAFDALLLQSDQLLSTSDDLVVALYSPQDPDHVRAETFQLANITTSFQAQLTPFFPATDHLAQQLHALSLKDTSAVTSSPSAPKKRADKKWFDTCIDHIRRLCSNLTEENSNGST